MKNTEKINPTCPPLYLSPPAIAVPAPTISYEYLIFKRQCFCYNHLFTLKKNHDRWKLTMAFEKNSYQIPATKTKEEIQQILISLGIENNLFKVEVYSKDIKVNKKYFITLKSLVNFIIETEQIVEGVEFV